MPVLRSNLYSKLLTVSKLESNENPEKIIMFTCEHRACDSEQMILLIPTFPVGNVITDEVSTSHS